MIHAFYVNALKIAKILNKTKNTNSNAIYIGVSSCVMECHTLERVQYCWYWFQRKYQLESLNIELKFWSSLGVSNRLDHFFCIDINPWLQSRTKCI